MLGGMTALGNAGLQQLALTALEHRVSSRTGAGGLADAVQQAYDDLARVAAPLIGQVGVDSLAGRAVHLAQRDYSWLVHTAEPVEADGPFARVIACLDRQDRAVATEAAGAVFATFIGLLVSFIGEPLTAHLVQRAWPDALSDASTEET